MVLLPAQIDFTI